MKSSRAGNDRRHRHVRTRALTANTDEDFGELHACSKGSQAEERWAVSEAPDGGRS